MAAYIGSRLLITRDDGQYEGVLHSFDAQNKRITLEKVTCHGSGKVMTGCFNFFASELENVQILEDRSNIKKRTKGKGSILLGKKDGPKHLKKLKDLEDKGLMFHSIAGQSSSSPSTADEAELLNKSSIERQGDAMPNDLGDCTKESVPKTMPLDESPDILSGREIYIIDKLEDVFADAIEHLQCQKFIGVAMEGINLGRNGDLCWIQMSTRKHVFLFDFLALGKPCLDQGLADIFEDPRIQKVIHDCRRISDMLHHMYGVKLVNVFDTQVADVLVNKYSHHDNLPSYVNGLPTCLFSYLNLSAEQVDMQRLREERLQGDQSTWAQRPPSEVVVNAAAKNVMYLQELRVALLERLLTEFTTGVDIYLSVLRDVPVGHERTQLSRPSMLPSEFNNLAYRAWDSRSQRHPRDSYSSNTYKFDEKGFRENCVGVVDPKIIYSRDGICHAGDGRINKNGTLKTCTVPERARKTRSRMGRHSSSSEDLSDPHRQKSRSSEQSLLQCGEQHIKMYKKEDVTEPRTNDIRSVEYEVQSCVNAQTKTDKHDKAQLDDDSDAEESPAGPVSPAKEAIINHHKDSDLVMLPAGINLGLLDMKSDPGEESKGGGNHGMTSSSEPEADSRSKSCKTIDEDFDVIPSQRLLDVDHSPCSETVSISANDSYPCSNSSRPAIGRGQALRKFLDNPPVVGVHSVNTLNTEHPSLCESVDLSEPSMQSDHSCTRPDLSNVRKGLGRAAAIAMFNK